MPLCAQSSSCRRGRVAVRGASIPGMVRSVKNSGATCSISLSAAIPRTSRSSGRCLPSHHCLGRTARPPSTSSSSSLRRSRVAVRGSLHPCTVRSVKNSDETRSISLSTAIRLVVGSMSPLASSPIVVLVVVLRVAVRGTLHPRHGQEPQEFRRDVLHRPLRGHPEFETVVGLMSPLAPSPIVDSWSSCAWQSAGAYIPAMVRSLKNSDETCSISLSAAILVRDGRPVDVSPRPTPIVTLLWLVWPYFTTWGSRTLLRGSQSAEVKRKEHSDSPPQRRLRRDPHLALLV